MMGAGQMQGACIVHVVPVFPRTSGVATFAGEVAGLQAAAGARIVLATLPGYLEDHYPVPSAVSVKDIRQLPSQEDDVSVVHLHGVWTPALHRVVTWARSRNVPIVWSPHGMLAPWAMAHKRWKKWPVWHLWQRRDLARAAVLHATSELEAGWIRDLGFRQPVEIVPLGTHLPAPERIADAAAKPQSPTSARHTLLFVGRIYPVKGLMNLLQAWSCVGNDLRSDWCIRVVGPDQAGHQAELEAACRRLGIAQQVVFPGAKYGDALETEYAGADCLVLPSFTENFGGVVVDALARGVPVIASTFTPWQELGCGERCGWWVSNAPDALSCALKEMMMLSDTDRRQMGAHGQVLVRRKYAWPAVVEALDRLYAMV